MDETGFLKKGEKSVGVARQYTGTAGRIENAQVGVFVAYASEKGAAFVDRALYLPREEWADDPLRREEAGVPDEVRFATKGELAKGMLRRAFEAKVPARWVVADTVYGTARGLRGWLEEQERSYVLAVPSTKGIYHEGRQRQARSLAKDLPEEAWAWESAGTGSKGERLYDWALVSLPEPEAPGRGRWLLMHRSIGDPTELAYYLAYGPKETPTEELIRVAGRRWQVEDCFEQAKGEVGLDEYEVRKWEAWQRHVTLSLLAHAYLAGGQKGDRRRDLELIPLTVPEVRRLILAMAGPEEEREFRLGWSLWRRAHQAVAKRCHTVRRVLHREKMPPPRPSHPATGAAVDGVPAPMNIRLTDEGWALLEPLLPSQKPPLGRPRRDHLTMLAGMLWVLGSGASWRDLPEEGFGPWQTVHARYRKWCREGLWQRIMEVLDS